MYVTHIDPQSCRVTIGPREEVMGSELLADRACWHGPVEEEFDATVQIRYNHTGCPGRVRRESQSVFRVRFDEPVHAITPGQAAVVYQGDKLLGGGWIVEGS
jgi:tRNA-specific 2-thiouridylase